MKKILSIALVVLMTAALAVSSFAAYQAQTADPSAIKFDIPVAYEEHVLDGVITEGEYAEIEIDPSWLSYATYDDAAMAAVQKQAVSLYMAYDAKYVYLAAETTADGFINECDGSEGSIWGQYAIQFSAAESTATDSGSRFESGYALSSSTGKLLTTCWNDGMGVGYDGTGDFIVVNDGGKLIYEVRVPFTAFGAKNLTKGQTFAFNIVWATGTDSGSSTSQYRHTQLGYGCTGDPGKDPSGFATVTLGDELEPPLVEDDEEEAAADEAAAEAPKAAKTADAAVVLAIVGVLGSGIVVSKKH